MSKPSSEQIFAEIEKLNPATAEKLCERFRENENIRLLYNWFIYSALACDIIPILREVRNQLATANVLETVDHTGSFIAVLGLTGFAWYMRQLFTKPFDAELREILGGIMRAEEWRENGLLK